MEKYAQIASQGALKVSKFSGALRGFATFGSSGNPLLRSVTVHGFDPVDYNFFLLETMMCTLVQYIDSMDCTVLQYICCT